MYTASVITVSDKGYSGEREDTAGPLVKELLISAGYDVRLCEIVPDEAEIISAALMRHADQEHIALIVTTGGTGFSVRDVTPEATMAVCDRMAPGIPEAMRGACLAITDKAMLSRSVCGLRGLSMILNLPGSPKAVRENLAPVLPALSHGLDMLTGARGECAAAQKGERER